MIRKRLTSGERFSRACHRVLCRAHHRLFGVGSAEAAEEGCLVVKDHADRVNMHEAKSQLSRLVAAAEAGEEVIIARRGKPAIVEVR